MCHALATLMLSGTVSLDNAYDLYTYTYTLDTTGFDGPIISVDIWQNVGFSFECPYSVSHTEPDGWQFVLLTGGVENGSFGNPENITGYFWARWLNHGNPTSTIKTFSFTTERDVNTLLANNYALYSNNLVYPLAI